MNRLRLLLPLLLLAASLAGCTIAVPDGKPVVIPRPALAPEQKAGLAYVDFTAFTGSQGLSAQESGYARRGYLPVVQRLLEESGYFTAVSFDAADRDKADTRLQLDLYTSQNEPMASISPMVVVFSVGVIPVAYRENLAIRLKVLDAAGQVAFRDSRADSLLVKVGWFFAGHPDKDYPLVRDALLERELAQALQAAHQAGQLRPPASAAL